MIDKSSYAPYNKDHIPPMKTSGIGKPVLGGVIPNTLETTPFHEHNGQDSPQVSYTNLTNTLASQGWSFSGTFSSSGASTVSWTTGTLSTSNKENFSIASGSVVMSLSTPTYYIYFDKVATLTAFQTTTDYATATGVDKILIAVAHPGVQNSQGATIVSDNFNSYTNGNLEGQGSWSRGGIATEFDVEGTVVYEGAKAIKNNNNNSGSEVNIQKTGSLLNDGLITVYVRLDAGNGGFRLLEGATTRIKTQFINGGTGSAAFVYSDSLNVNVTFGVVPVAGTWYALQIQWRSSDHTVRYNINGGTWTAWVAPLSVWSTGMDIVSIVRAAGNNQTMYWDTIERGIFSTDATFQVFGGTGGVFINSSNIAPHSITADQLNITQLSDITPDLGSITSGTLADITGFGLRDTTASFDVTIAMTSSPAISAARILTVDMGNVAHTLALGTTANTITFPNAASFSVYTTATGSITSAQLATSLTDETGSGVAVFATSPTIVTPIIAKLANLTTNGFVKTSGGDGTLSVDTSTYLPKTSTVSATGQSADIGSTNLTTTGAGLYRLAYYLLDSSADLTAGAIRLNVAYTDAAAAQTAQSATVALTILGTFTSGEIIIQLASGNIAYSTTHTGIFGTATYNLYMTLERLN